MGDQTEKNYKRPLCLGILAHVDAGKTTLTEAMLYLSGRIKKLGRVDHRDSFLDTHLLERERGITIFSKQAVLETEDSIIYLMDTPGHVDFSAEAERTLSVLDCAVLVISGTDGVQAHTETLWRLLRRYAVPCFVFFTKMDLPGADRASLMADISRRLGEGFVDILAPREERDENAAMCAEWAMEQYLETGALDDAALTRLVGERAVFPCFFGSGLKTEGVAELLDGICAFAPHRDYPDEFSARVYKISRDAQGKRMSFLKVTGGSLSVRELIKYKDENGVELEEKISQIRIYSGMKFDAVETVRAGHVCAVLGLSGTYPLQGLGASADAEGLASEPVLSYRVILPTGADPALVLPKLRLLQEEDPQLRLVWDERRREISVQLMGKVQTEVFIRLVEDRFDLKVSLDTPRVMYRETIADTVEGVGHFEPLRHYAEVHLLMEPLPAGSGIVLDSMCSEDVLDRNWQRLILTHLQEKPHLGVLTGAPVTDMKISLASGRAHLKHTEGGDFRQATYRAVRQGLMQAQSVLLEPYYRFELEVPTEQIGRAISDVRMMNGEFDSPEENNGMSIIRGSAPVAAMNGYMAELVAYSHGRGRLSFRPDGYRPCKNQKEIVSAVDYDPEADLENTPDSVFCAHGAGYNVKWDQVKDYMHLESCLVRAEPQKQPERRRMNLNIDERELEAIMEREFGPIKRPSYNNSFRNEAPERNITISPRKEYIIVDGYNVIFAWDELKALAAQRLDLARGRLMDMLSNYCGFTKAELVLVFDGFRTPGNPGSKAIYHNINVAYTKDGETADAYIERMAGQIGKNYSVRVISSDNLIRLSALHSGVLRTSSGEFEHEVDWVLTQIEQVLKKSNESAHKIRVRDGKQ